MIGAVHHGNRENCLGQDDIKLVLPSTTLSCMAFFEKTLKLRDKDETDEWLSFNTDICRILIRSISLMCLTTLRLYSEGTVCLL